MEALCLDIVNSDWHDYRGTGKDEDRLLKSSWLEHTVARWGLAVNEPADGEAVARLQGLRSLMYRMIEAVLQKREMAEQDIVELNSYLDVALSKQRLVSVGGHYELRQVLLNDGWQRVVVEVAISFAELMALHDLGRLKQCENPDCRWVYYDESANQNRRWCEDTCANLMRVRRFRARRQGKA